MNEAINYLIEQLGIACGSVEDAYHTSLGHTISQSETVVHSTGERRLKLSGHEVGGDVNIKLSGEAQPEAARVLDKIIGLALEKHAIPDAKIARRISMPDAGNTGRLVRFSVPDNKSSDFSQSLTDMAKKIQRSWHLKKECYKGVTFSLEVVNQIEGAKPFVWLNVPEGKDEKPYFSLHIEGTPDSLAATLADIMHKNIEEFPDSKERKNRDASRMMEGGKDVDIPLNADFTDTALSGIGAYVERMESLKKPRLGDGKPECLLPGQNKDKGKGRPQLPGPG